jgi:rhodanese-related sulfurtransferase
MQHGLHAARRAGPGGGGRDRADGNLILAAGNARCGAGQSCYEAGERGEEIWAGMSGSGTGMTRWRVRIGLGLLLAAAVLIAWRMTLIPPDYPGGRLSVAEAHAQADDGAVLLVDIRRPDEWRRTGVPEGAVPLDMRRDDFIAALAGLTGEDRSRPVALICARGVRSARLATRLSAAGFTQVRDVPEGMLGSAAGPGWLAAGLPVETPPGARE